MTNLLKAISKALGPHSKAITSFIGTAIITYLSVSANGVTRDEWLFILVSSASASGAVWLVPNKSKLTK